MSEAIAAEGPTVIAWMFTFMAIVAVLVTFHGDAGSFLKEQTLELQSERIKNAAMALSSVPEGSIEIPISGYTFHVKNGEMILGFDDKRKSVKLDAIEGYSGFNWDHREPQKIKDSLCLRKTLDSGNPVLGFEKGGCG